MSAVRVERLSQASIRSLQPTAMLQSVWTLNPHFDYVAEIQYPEYHTVVTPHRAPSQAYPVEVEPGSSW